MTDDASAGENVVTLRTGVEVHRLAAMAIWLNIRTIAQEHPAVLGGHCCFFPASQTCHQTEVAEWERQRDARLKGRHLGA